MNHKHGYVYVSMCIHSLVSFALHFDWFLRRAMDSCHTWFIVWRFIEPVILDLLVESMAAGWVQARVLNQRPCRWFNDVSGIMSVWTMAVGDHVRVDHGRR